MFCIVITFGWTKNESSVPQLIWAMKKFFMKNAVFLKCVCMVYYSDTLFNVWPHFSRNLSVLMLKNAAK